MARVNVEDSLFSDLRFMSLSQKIGQVSAIGCLVLAWRTAQKFWLQNKGPIPSVQFRLIPFNEDLIEVGFAVYSDENKDFVYICGAEEQFSWLIQRQSAGRKNIGKNRERNETELNETERNANGANPLTLTLPLTLSLSQEKKRKNTSALASRNREFFALSSEIEIKNLANERQLRDVWINRVDLEYVAGEEAKMVTWLLANPQKKVTRRGFSRFYNSWLERGYEQHRKNLKSNTSFRGIEQILADEKMAGQNYD